MDIEKLSQALDLASKYGIESVKQFNYFLQVNNREAGYRTLKDLAGVDSSLDEKYKRYLSHYLRLSNGSKCRNRNGLLLLSLTSKKEGLVVPTAKGRLLVDELINIGIRGI